MANYSESFDGLADGNLAASPSWLAGQGTINVAAGTVKGTTTLDMAYVDAEFRTFAPNQNARIEFANPPLAYDSPGAVVRANGLNWYSAHLVDGSFQLCRYDNAVKAVLGTFAAPNATTGDYFEVRATGDTIELWVSLGGGALTQQISVTDATYASGQPGIMYIVGDSASTLADNFYAIDDGVSTPTIDSVNNGGVVTTGANDVVITISGFTNPIDTVTLESGGVVTPVTIESVSGTSYTLSTADLVATAAGGECVPFTTASHVVTLKVVDSVSAETASTVVTHAPPSTHAVIEVSGVTNTQGKFSENFAYAVPDTSQVTFPTADNTDVASNGDFSTDNMSSPVPMMFWNATTKEHSSFERSQPANPPTDTTPDAFTFTSTVDATESTQVSSNTITVSGIDASASISISGAGFEYSVNGGAFGSAAGTVSNGNTVQLRTTASATYDQAIVGTLTIGGVGGTWSVTTRSDPNPTGGTTYTASQRIINANDAAYASTTLDYVLYSSWGGAVADSGQVTTDSNGNLSLTGLTNSGVHWIAIKNPSDSNEASLFEITAS